MNVAKTKGKIVDFILNKPSHGPVTISTLKVDIVTSFTDLATLLTSDLSWDEHVRATVKKGPQIFTFGGNFKSSKYAMLA